VVSRFVRKVRTSSGAVAVQIVTRRGQRVEQVEHLLQEIRGRGYRGGERTLRRYLVAIRGTSTTPPPPPAPPSSRTITSWIMRPPAKVNDQVAAALAAACDACPDLATIRDLARGFTDLVRQRGGKRLNAWIEQAQQGSIPYISAFATGLYKDLKAVTAGLTTAWSSGAVEGNVNIKVTWNLPGVIMSPRCNHGLGRWLERHDGADGEVAGAGPARTGGGVAADLD
jgi:hypothetical protein